MSHVFEEICQKQGLNAHVKANRCQSGAIRPEPRNSQSQSNGSRSPDFFAISNNQNENQKVSLILKSRSEINNKMR